MERPRTSLCVALAALAYLVIALFVLRAVLPSPGRLLPYPRCSTSSRAPRWI